MELNGYEFANQLFDNMHKLNYKGKHVLDDTVHLLPSDYKRWCDSSNCGFGCNLIGFKCDVFMICDDGIWVAKDRIRSTSVFHNRLIERIDGDTNLSVGFIPFSIVLDYKFDMNFNPVLILGMESNIMGNKYESNLFASNIEVSLKDKKFDFYQKMLNEKINA